MSDTRSYSLVSMGKICAIIPLIALVIAITSWTSGGALTGLVVAIYAAPAAAALGLVFGVASAIRKEPEGAVAAIVLNACWLLAIGSLYYWVSVTPLNWK